MQKPNFTHIDDTVSGLVLVDEKGYGDEFGIEAPKAYTIFEIARMFGGENTNVSRKMRKLYAYRSNCHQNRSSRMEVQKNDYITELKKTDLIL